MPDQPVAPAHAERQPAVGRGVAHRGQRQRDGVRPAGAERGRAAAGTGTRRPACSHADAEEARHRAVRQQPRHPAQVVQRGARRCPRASRGRRPSRPAPRGCAARAAGRAPAARCRRTSRRRARRGSSARAASPRIALKPHWASEKRARSAVCSSRLYAREISSRFGPRTTRAPRRQPRADGDVAVAGQQRRDEREQRAQVGRQVDVHVADDRRVAGRPGRAQRAAAAPAASSRSVTTPGSVGRQRGGDGRGGVGRGVVGDDDAPAEREARRAGSGAAGECRRLQPGLLVVDGDDDVDVRRGRGERPPRHRSGDDGEV